MGTVFVNVDTQKDFMRNDEAHQGTLYIKEAEGIEDRLAQLTSMARERKLTVINTADWHTTESKEFSETPDFIETFPAHCLEHTVGASYVSATEPQDSIYTIDWRDKTVDTKAIRAARNIVVRKDAFDVFSGNPHTEKVYDIIQAGRAIVYGVATDVCVDQHIQGLIKRGVEVYAVQDAMKEIPIRPLEETLENWTSQGVKLINTEEVESLLGNKIYIAKKASGSQILAAIHRCYEGGLE